MAWRIPSPTVYVPTGTLAILAVLAHAPTAMAKPTVWVDAGDVDALRDAVSVSGTSVLLDAGVYALAAGGPIVLAEGVELHGPGPATAALSDGTLVPVTDVDPDAPVAVIVGEGLTFGDTSRPQAAIRALGDNVVSDIIVEGSTGDAAFLLEGDFSLTRCVAVDGEHRGFEVAHYMNVEARLDMSGRSSRGELISCLARGNLGDHGIGLQVKNESRFDQPELADASWTITTRGCQWYGNQVGETTEHVVNARHNTITRISSGDRWVYNHRGTWFDGGLFTANDNRTRVTIEHGRIANNSGDPMVGDGDCGGAFILGSWEPAQGSSNNDNEMLVTLTDVAFTDGPPSPELAAFLAGAGLGAMIGRQNGSYLFGGFGVVRADLGVMASFPSYLLDPGALVMESTGNSVRLLMSGCTSDNPPGAASSVIIWNASWAWLSATKTPGLGWLSDFYGHELDWGDRATVVGSPKSFAAANPGFNAVEASFYSSSP